MVGDRQILEHNRMAMAAAGIVGTYERDHKRQTVRYCRGAAELMAGDPNLAWRDLTLDEGLANVYIDDVTWVCSQMRRAASVPGVHIREQRVRDAKHGVRHVLCRGRTYLGADGTPSYTLGVVIDITELEADGRRRFATGDDMLDSAAGHGMAAYEAIRSTGLASLVQPARALLMAIGREIAQGISRRRKALH